MTDVDDRQLRELVEEIEKDIVVPEPKGEKFLLCPVGIVGAGKTTVVKPLAAKLGLVRISNDEIRKKLKERGFGYDRTEEITFALANRFLVRGFGVALDSDCASRKTEINEQADKASLTVIWIHINPPEEFILNKLRSYRHAWLFKDADDAIRNYEARKPLHEKLDFPFTCVFDPSRPDLDKQIDEAASLIAAKVSGH